MVSAGHYFTLLIIYLAVGLLISLLKEKLCKCCEKVQIFAKRQYINRLKYASVNEFVWFSFMTFGFFSMFQMKDLKPTVAWQYGNLVLSFLCFLVFVGFPVFVIVKALKYRKDMSKVPKRFAFIVGDQSFIPYQIPFRYFRKVLLCVFLVIGTIEIQVPAMIAANFLVFAFYLFFKPSKSTFTNWINILVEVCYIGMEVMLMIFSNDTGMTTSTKLTYGKVMIAFALIAILLALMWTVWQFLQFLYEWKFIRDIILEAQIANKIYPEQDNLKVEFEKEPEQHDENLLSENNSILNPIKERRSENGDILGIEHQYAMEEKFVVYDKGKEPIERESIGLFPKSNNKPMELHEEDGSSVDLRQNSSDGFEEVQRPLRGVRKLKREPGNDKPKKDEKKQSQAVKNKLWQDIDLDEY